MIRRQPEPNPAPFILEGRALPVEPKPTKKKSKVKKRQAYLRRDMVAAR